MNSELAALAERLTREYEEAEENHRAAQTKLREVQAEIVRVRSAAKLLDEPDPFAEALRRRRDDVAGPTVPPAAAKPQKRNTAPAKDHAASERRSAVHESPAWGGLTDELRPSNAQPS